MRFPFVTSLVLHLFVILALSYGFKFDDNIDVPPPINVEIVDIAEINQTTKQKPPEPPKKKKEPEPKEKPKEEKKKPSLAKPSAPVEPEVEETAVPLPDQKAEIVEKKPKPKDKPKPPQVKPKLKDTKPIKQEPNDEPFKSVLKNLVGETPPQEKEEAKEDSSEVTQQASLADRMTISEMDALRRQLEGCWNVPIGAKDAEDLIVELRLTVRPDKTVKDVKIVDLGRYNRDPFFRAAADSAVRAVLSDDCNPLILPEGKYNQWKTITFKFNPKEMF